MDLREIVPGVYAAPQLAPSDMAALADMGVTTLICNRPEMENPPPLQAGPMQAAAEAAGLAFVFNPITMGAMTLDNVEEQADAMAASEGAVVAYCASGTRSAVMWALAHAGQMPTDEILAATAQAGYPLEGLRAQIDSLAANA